MASSLRDENGHHYTEDQARDLIRDYMTHFPGIKKFVAEAHREAKENGVVFSMFGRPRRIPKAKIIPKIYGNTPHDQMEYKWRTLLNLAVNHKIQASAASIVNRAAIKFYAACREQGLDAKIIMQVHDELIVECPEEQAEAVKLLLKECMETAVTIPGVPITAAPVVAKDLASLK